MYNIENTRYTGNKNALADWIIPLIEKECVGDSFADLFAGTGSLIPRLKNTFNRFIINDLLYSNSFIYKAFLKKGIVDDKKLVYLEFYYS